MITYPNGNLATLLQEKASHQDGHHPPTGNRTSLHFPALLGPSFPSLILNGSLEMLSHRMSFLIQTLKPIFQEIWPRQAHTSHSNRALHISFGWYLGYISPEASLTGGNYKRIRCL
ncbi:hypothetical protein HAX54_028541 [Datura stramonium]|uniref:Uncharacterized protein n=1 Tax=Datura stramonium TaxID=4076 RepID=A0ABS8V6X5_DATST|nr:hypothetical protein [Datura stramonium]